MVKFLLYLTSRVSVVCLISGEYLLKIRLNLKEKDV